MKNAPIIFCHYGNSKYLPYVFECIKLSNKNKEIILLGDESNIAVARLHGISHVILKDYDFGDDLRVFDDIYQLITTRGFDSHKHGEDWNKFVFRKWFILNNFLIKNSIEQFWHFDSDTMIFTDLSTLEDRYKNLDCTEQCMGYCMKGFFTNSKIIGRYTAKINEVFQRKPFIEGVKESMKNHNDVASFNEMSVYTIFKQEESFKTVHLIDIVDDSFFDDLMCRGHGMKMEKLPLGEDTKVVFLNSDGRFFCQEEETGKLIHAHALNLSWIPIYIYKAILKHFKTNYGKPSATPTQNTITLAQVSVPIKQRLKLLRKAIKKLVLPGSKVLPRG